MRNRPSKNEIIQKPTQALDAVRQRRRAFAVTKHLVNDLDCLELDSEAVDWQKIEVFLAEIVSAGPLSLYAGGRPPQRSYEVGIENAELWAYCWESAEAKRRMYLKFALKNGHYYHVDCHESSEK